MQQHKKTELISIIVAVVFLIIATIACARMVVQEREMGKLRDENASLHLKIHIMESEQTDGIYSREGSR